MNSRHADEKLLAELESLCSATALPVSNPIEREAELQQRSADLIREARRRDAEQRFLADCETGYPESDWSHPKLATNRAQIERVLAWQIGARGLLLSGPTGTGKTRSIFGLYRRLAVELGIECRYFFAGDFFSRLGEQIHFGRDDARLWVEALAAKPIVIIDDLGQESVTAARADWSAGWFFSFLNIRIARHLPLIVSTNLTADEIAGKFGAGSSTRHDPLVRRLLDLCDIVKFSPR